MKRKGSRYEQTKPFSNKKGFDGYRERKVTTPPGLVEHSLLHMDRLDHMAGDYYKQDRRWWRILDANPDFLYGFDMLGYGHKDDGAPPEGETPGNAGAHGDGIAIPASRESGQ